MTRIRYVAIEGPCCAGKTTLGDGLMCQLGTERATLIPDYADFVGGGSGMPDPDPASWDEEQEALAALMEIEVRRLHAYLTEPLSELVLIDRSAVTLLAHCSGLEHRDVRARGFTAQATAGLAEDARPCWPEAVIYLDVSHPTQLQRNDGKFAEGSVFMDVDYNHGFRAYFHQQREQGRLPMVWIDAEHAPETVIEQALDFLTGEGHPR